MCVSSKPPSHFWAAFKLQKWGVNVFDDMTLIVHKLSMKYPYINIYGIGDKHIGSKECDIKRLKKQVEMILDDEYGYCVICGDLINNGLKNSKTNTYQEVIQPAMQKELMYEIYKPLAYNGKILAGVPGNHCERTVKEAGTNPMYDVFCRWNIPHLYRENIALLKINLGSRKDGQRQISYAGLVTHGSSKNKHHKFVMGFDGIDFAISGHTHTPEYTPRGKIRIDLKNETAKKVGYKEIVVDSSLESGGYAIKNEYEISAPPETQILKLYGTRKRMDYLALDNNE